MPSHKATPIPTKPCLLILLLLKWCTPWQTKHSNIQAYGCHSYSNHPVNLHQRTTQSKLCRPCSCLPVPPCPLQRVLSPGSTSLFYESLMLCLQIPQLLSNSSIHAALNTTNMKMRVATPLPTALVGFITMNCVF